MCIYIYKVHVHAYYIKITIRNVSLSEWAGIYPINSLQKGKVRQKTNQ